MTPKKIIPLLALMISINNLPASADIIVIPGDYPTIQQGIDAASSVAIGGDDIENQIKQNSENNSNADSNTLRSIDEIVRNLEIEITTPSSDVRRVGSYLTISQQTVRRFISELKAMGPAYADYIYAKKSQVGAATSSALTISLGLMKDPRVHDEVREIVLEETDPSIRGMAVVALSTYMDTLDVPAFIQALSDTNIVVMELDVFTLDGESSRRVGIVGIATVPALNKLGYEVQIDTVNNTYEVVKKIMGNDED